MNRRDFLKTVGCAAVACSFGQNEQLSAASPKKNKQPNIVLICADDMGFGDVGYHGFKDILTPNIDRIATEGVQFTQGYISASVCGPSRAGLLTGVYQQRFGCGENPSSTGWPDNVKFPMAGLPRSQPMMAEMLKRQGYTTGMVGKWHLGVHESLRPHSRGFDFYYGFLNGSHDYTEWTTEFAQNKSRWPVFRNNEMEPPRKDIYLTDLFSDEAVGFIDRSKDEPFFLYMAYNAVHHPWQVPEKYLQRTKGLTDCEDRNFFAAMVLAMDDGVGRVFQALEKHGIAGNTAVIFLSDNGSPRGQGLKNEPKSGSQERIDPDSYMSTPGPLRGFKGDVYEGGIRVPFCMRWPGRIKPGTKYDLPVSALDIVPTFVKDGTFDGVDLLSYISGKKTGRPHEVMYWRRDNDYAIRRGDWKLQWNDAGGTPTIKLFNLADDPGEYHDLAQSQPERAQMLQDLFDEWDNTLPDNEWWGGPWNRKRHRTGKFSVAEFNANPDKGNIYRKIESAQPSADGITLQEQLEIARANAEKSGRTFDVARTTRWFNAKDLNKDGLMDEKERQTRAPVGWID